MKRHLLIAALLAALCATPAAAAQNPIQIRDQDVTIDFPEQITFHAHIESSAEIERVLELEPGSLSRLLGYVPPQVGERHPPSVIESARSDPQLGESERDLLVAVYRELVRQSAARRAKQAE